MTSYPTYRYFFMPFLLLLFFCDAPSFSSDIEDSDHDTVSVDLSHHPTCSHRPDSPYTLEEPPEYLANSPHFNHLKKIGHYYWVTGNGFAVGKYVVGVAATAVANAAQWGFISEEAKEGLGVTIAVLTLTAVVFQGLETGASAKGKTYKNEAKAMVATANLNAGLPVQAVLPSHN